MDVLSLIIRIVLCVFAVFLIAIVLLQSGNKAGVSGTFGGAEALMGKTKARGLDALLSKLTKIVAVSFMVLSVGLVVIQKVAA